MTMTKEEITKAVEEAISSLQVTMGAWIPKCLECVAVYKVTQNQIEEATRHNALTQQRLDGLEAAGKTSTLNIDFKPVPELPEIKDSYTLAPSWQSQIVQGQMVISCVAVGSCLEHLGVKMKSAAERAAQSGLVVGGSG
jgi:hypothetical protein